MDAPKLTRTEARQARTRRRLREVGHELFSTVGVDATTIQQITDGADIGFGTFYNYYDTKEALAQDVLDCLIHNIGEKNDLITEQLGETDPVRIVANSVRFVLSQVVTDPLYRWWVDRCDVLADRMRIGFAPFGLRDIDNALAAGSYHLIDDDRDLAWSQLIWIATAGARDMVTGHHSPDRERYVVEGILRVMGVDPDSARAAVNRELPKSPDLPVDFTIDPPAHDQQELLAQPVR